MKQSDAAGLVVSLFESLGPSLYRYALRSTASPEASDDIVQEAFMGLHRDLRRGKRIDSPEGWVFGAVRNQVRKHQRREKLHAETLCPQQALDDLPGGLESGASEERNDVMRLLGVLSEREEEVVLLRMQSLKYREIGDSLEISPKTVATLLARALKKLQQAARTGFGRRAPSPRTGRHVSETLQ